MLVIIINYFYTSAILCIFPHAVNIVFQKIKELKMTPLAIDGNTAIIRWYLDYIDTRTGEEIIMDGIYQVEFNEFGKCTMFIQWWVMKE